MEHMLYPQPGYPFLLRISIEYALSRSGLLVQTTATNLGRRTCPYGSGAHPYLTLGTATIDGLILQVPGRTVLRSDERGLPIRREAVEGAEYDFRQSKRIVGATVMEKNEDDYTHYFFLRSTQSTLIYARILGNAIKRNAFGRTDT